MRAEIEAVATEIRAAVDLLRRHLNWDEALRRLDELNARAEDPALWGSADVAQKVMRERTQLEQSTAAVYALERELSDNLELIELGEAEGDAVVVADAEAALDALREKSAKLKDLGADFVFDPADPQLRKAILAAIQPHRVDLAVDNVAGTLFNQVVALLGYGGKISVVGRSGGEVPDFNTGTLFFRRNRIGGVAVSDYTPETAQSAWKEIVARLEAAGRRPVVDSIFAFQEVPAAFRRLAEGPMGKVLVRGVE